MKELEENTIEQIRTLLNYLEQTDLLKNKEILRCLDVIAREYGCLLYTSPSPRDRTRSRMPSSA